MFWSIKQLVRKEFEEWRRLADIAALEKLSDRQLADIGLRRDQLFTLETQSVDAAWERPATAAVFRPGFEPCG